MPIFKNKKITAGLFVLIYLAVFAIVGTIIQNALMNSRIMEHGVRFQDFPDLARSFLQGRTWIPPELLTERTYSDGFIYNGNIYLPFAPLSPLLFVPLVIFWPGVFPTLAVSFVILAGIGYLAFLIFRQLNLNDTDSGWLALAYTFGSAVFPLAFPISTSWFVVLLANLFLLSAVLAKLHHKNPWLIGVLLGLAVATRPAALLGVGLFIFFLLYSESKKRNRKKIIIPILLPIILALSLFGFYNQIRFANPLNSGYRAQWVLNHSDKMPFGATDLRYIPKNIYYFQFAPPDLIIRFPYVVPNHMGMGLLFGSPFFIYLILGAKKSWKKNRLFKPALICSLIGLLPAFSYYASGFSQIGYRYAVDVYPLLFLALAVSFFGKIPRLAKILIAIAIINHLLWLTMFLI